MLTLDYPARPTSLNLTESSVPTVPKERTGLTERSRSPSLFEPQYISSDEIIVVVKRSKLELDLERLGSVEKVKEEYTEHGITEDEQSAIINSHFEQIKSRKIVSEALPGRVIYLEGVNGEEFAKAKLVIALGGDNHFQGIAHLVGDRLFMGINSDPAGSDAILTQLQPQDIARTVGALARGSFKIQEWTQIAATLNGVKLPLACSEIFVGETDRFNMSRHSVENDNGRETQKCSGILLSTGAGSTGWYDSAVRYLEPDGAAFPRTNRCARYLVTEPFKGRLNIATQKHFEISKEHPVTIKSRNDANGVVAIDCRERFPFARGARLDVAIADRPLRVVIPMLEEGLEQNQRGGGRML